MQVPGGGPLCLHLPEGVEHRGKSFSGSIGATKSRHRQVLSGICEPVKKKGRIILSVGKDGESRVLLAYGVSGKTKILS